MVSVTQLRRSSPQAEGIPSSAVLEFIREVEQHVHPMDAVQGFMLLRHGNVVAEGWWTPYGPESPHPLQSLSKSFTSTGIGLAVQEGLLTVDDPVLKFFPDDAPANPSENLKAMRVRHLLSMNTEATKPHSDNSNTQTNPDWTVGYGYQFWRCRHNCYRSDGAFGQYCIVMPEQDAVLAIIGGLQNMQTVLDKVWQHLLPAIQPKTLPTDPQGYGALCEKLAVLSLPLPNGQRSSPKSNQWSGKTYKLDSNHLKLESVAITFNHECSTLSFATSAANIRSGSGTGPG